MKHNEGRILEYCRGQQSSKSTKPYTRSHNAKQDKSQYRLALPLKHAYHAMLGSTDMEYTHDRKCTKIDKNA